MLPLTVIALDSLARSGKKSESWEVFPGEN